MMIQSMSDEQTRHAVGTPQPHLKRRHNKEAQTLLPNYANLQQSILLHPSTNHQQSINETSTNASVLVR